jgi:hypothetical protein
MVGLNAGLGPQRCLPADRCVSLRTPVATVSDSHSSHILAGALQVYKGWPAVVVHNASAHQIVVTLSNPVNIFLWLVLQVTCLAGLLMLTL